MCWAVPNNNRNSAHRRKHEGVSTALRPSKGTKDAGNDMRLVVGDVAALLVFQIGNRTCGVGSREAETLTLPNELQMTDVLRFQFCLHLERKSAIGILIVE